MKNIVKLAEVIAKRSWLASVFNQEIALLKQAALSEGLAKKLDSLNRDDNDFVLIKNEIEQLNPKYYGKAMSVLNANPQISFEDFKASFELSGQPKAQKIDLLAVYSNKYPDQAEDFRAFAESDPSKSLKYFTWQAKMLLAAQAPAAELIDIANLFHKHNEKLEKKDINQYKPEEAASLRDLLFSFEEKKKERELKEDAVACGNNELYRSDICIVKHIFNKDASCHYGKDTKWCISGGLSKNYFNDYDSNNVVFFFVLSKFEKPYNKIAIVYERDNNNSITGQQIFDSEDKQISDLPKMFANEAKAIFTLTKNTAKNYPKSLVARLKSNEASQDEIEKLFNDIKQSDDQEYKLEIAYLIAEKTSSGDMLTELSSIFDDPGVRKYIAINPNTPLKTLENFLTDKSDSVRKRLALNNRLTAKHLDFLATDDSIDVKRAVAYNKNTSREALIILANNQDTQIKKNVASNPNTPDDVVISILTDFGTPEIYNFLVTSIKPKVLSYFAKDPNKYIRVRVANNRNTPIDVLIQLATDPDTKVRTGVVLNLNVTNELLAELAANDPDRIVREEAMNQQEIRNIDNARADTKYIISNSTNLFKLCQHFETTVAEDEEDDAYLEEPLPDYFKQMTLAIRKNKAARQELEKEESPIRAPMKPNGWVLIHRSTKKPGYWQATYFDDNDEPWGDSESTDFARLLYHADGNGIDWLRAERVGRKPSLDNTPAKD